jgi:hypothetical protein
MKSSGEILRVLWLLTSALAFSVCAYADFIANLPGGAITTNFDAAPNAVCSDRPNTAIDAGFTISSDGAACFPASDFDYFGDNGIWLNLPYISDGSGDTTLTIDLKGSFISVGGFFNYFAGVQFRCGLHAWGFRSDDNGAQRQYAGA